MFAWKQDVQWRRQAARAYDDLAEDLAAGQWPLRTCVADEMALYRTMDYAQELSVDLPALGELLHSLPEHPDDHDWEMIKEQLLLDTDLYFMLDLRLDGVERPDSFRNQAMRIGDYPPARWFDTFEDAQLARDPGRGFRR